LIPSAVHGVISRHDARQHFDSFEAATTALQTWERTYNVDRFSLALQGRTPAEKLVHLLPAAPIS
jgi:hypothetical protein